MREVDGLSDWNSSVQTFESCRHYSTQDYLVTTMKLRKERASTGKPKANRIQTRSKALKSAPPFQTRNLDNFPMPHGREDVLRSAKGQRIHRTDTVTKMTVTKVESGTLKDYSKQMFDFAVKSAQPLNHPSNGYKGVASASHRTYGIIHPQHIKSAKSTGYLDRSTNPHSGPTNDGSILYNRKQQVLNSIRLRPQTRYTERYDHERSNSSQGIRSTINNKNEQYKILNLNGNCAKSFKSSSIRGESISSVNDLVLVPIDPHGSEYDCGSIQNLHIQNNPILDFSLSNLSEIESTANGYRETFHDDVYVSDEAVPEPEPEDMSPPVRRHRRHRKHQRHPSVNRKLLPPSTTSNMRIVSLDEPSSSESEVEPEAPPPEVKKPEPPPKGQTKKGKVPIPEPEPEPKPVYVKRILKGPHCWVDDATITSDLSDQEADDMPDGNDVIPPQPEVKPTATTDKQPIQKKDAILLNKQSDLTNSKTAVKQTIPQDINKTVENIVAPDNDLKQIIQTEPECVEPKEEEFQFPSYLCPSSERKSREAAIKDWLSNTCFRSGNRGVPLV